MSELIVPSRRGFLAGLLAAPAIVRASSLMSIKTLAELPALPLLEEMSLSAQYAAAMKRQLSKEVLPIVQRSLVAYQFADRWELPPIQPDLFYDARAYARTP